MKIELPKVLKSGNDDSFLFNDKQRAIKNHKLMQWAKVATFGLYMVAVFMLYVSDVWGIGSFIEKNSNEYVALVIFSIIAFVLAYFLASSKEAVYEDIAVHRSEGWKLKPSQYAAMGLFLSSGILFEMFSTTNNQQHIANTAAEQSTMMKSIQTTDVSILGSSGLTDSYAKAQVRLASCQKRLSQGKAKDCVESQANLEAVKDSMAMSNQLATTAAKQSMDNKVDGMLKIREHFDKPMFQAIGKATGTDNNSGMLMVVGVLIFIFELQPIMALFAYANALMRLNRKGVKTESSPSPLGNESMNGLSAPVSGFNSLADSAKQTVGEYAAKVEEGLKAAPEAIATEMMKAQYTREKMDAATANMLGNVGSKLDDALNAENRRKYPQEILFPKDECKTADDYQMINRVDKTPTPLPKMPVVETIQRIYADVKASGANTPDAIQAGVFDAYARIPSPAELDDKDLLKVAEKITDKLVATPTPSMPTGQKPGATGLHNPVLGKAEAIYPLPLPNAFPESVSKRAHTVENAFEKRAHTVENAFEKRAHALTNTLSATSIYADWLDSINTSTCKKTVRDTRTWVQKRLAGNQNSKMTPNPKEFAAITEMLFSRAVKDPSSGIRLNPDFRSGGKKYL
jgi:hypothetical protein